MSESDSSFLVHLEALRQVLWRDVAAIFVLLIPGFFVAVPLLECLIILICPQEFKLNYFSPMEPLIVQLKLGLLLAIIGAMPVILWQTARFVAPGLYAHERSVCLNTVVVALLLFFAGAAIGLFGAAPLMMRFSADFASESLAPVIGIGNFVNLVALLSLSFGVMFQLPVLLVFLVKFGIIELAALRRSRPIAVVLIFVLAAILTPPDIVSQLMLGVPTWLLFEFALIVAGHCKKNENMNSEITEKPIATDSDSRRAKAETISENGEKSAIDAVYRDSWREKRRKNRHFGVINTHYRGQKGVKK
ncbi:MAG: twin-arginine translocase subunit TatC [Victivallales bacterium]|jgi:sec-independent protein translocase protein TatC|nr:twin-arginine translocase subunit TatC [Victivallales bacterium]